MYDDAAALLEAHTIVRLAAEPWHAGDTVKAALWRVQRAFPWLTYRRIRTFWFHEYCVVTAAEIINLRAWREEHLAQKERRLRAELELLEMRRIAREDRRAETMAAAAGDGVGRRGEDVRPPSRGVRSAGRDVHASLSEPAGSLGQLKVRTS